MNKLPDIGCFYEWNNDVVLKFDRKNKLYYVKSKGILLRLRYNPNRGEILVTTDVNPW